MARVELSEHLLSLAGVPDALSAALGPHAVVHDHGAVRLTVDVCWHRALTASERDALSAHLPDGVWLYADEGVSAGLRRLTVWIDADPPHRAPDFQGRW